jgi:hypothetical protein
MRRGRLPGRVLRCAVTGLAVLALAACSGGGGPSHGAGGSPTVAGPGGAGPTAGASGGSTPAAPEPLPSGPGGVLPVALPQLSSVDGQDPVAVSRAAVIIEWTMDTVTDSSQYQAELRSGPFLTPAYLASLRENPPVAAPGAQWDEWSAHRAWTTVVARPEFDDQPPDSPVVALRQWGITVTPHGAGGWTGTPVQQTVFVTMTRTLVSQPWRVSAIQVSM